MATFFDTFPEVINTANSALQELKENKQRLKEKNKDLLTTITESLDKIDFGKSVFNPFDLDKFVTKSKIDLMFFEHLIANIPEESIEKVEELITKLIKQTKTIYEIVNIEPELYSSIKENLIEESIETRSKTIQSTIYEYLDRVFYSLSPEQRKEKYLSECQELVKIIIKEHNIDVDEAVQFGIKTKLVENLIRNISFPRSVYARIQYLTESDVYKAVFDKEYLQEQMEKYFETVNGLSRVIAASLIK